MTMSDPDGLAEYLSTTDGHSERSHSFAVAWFLEASMKRSATVMDICSFLEEHKVRHGVRKNSGRVRSHFKKEQGFSVLSDDKVSLTRKKAAEFSEQYGRFLGRPSFTAPDRILPAPLIEGNGRLIVLLSEQINGCFHIRAFDACAVLMRRLMECKIIQLYNRDSRRTEILDQDGEYLGLEKLIAKMESDARIKLTRGLPKVMRAVKKLGDRGAHSTTVMVLEQDISDVSSDLRALISELG